MKKVHFIAVGNLVIQILTEFWNYGLNPSIIGINENFPKQNCQIWNFIVCKVYRCKEKDALFDWKKFRFPGFNKGINFEKENFCTVMGVLLIFYTNYVIAASMDTAIKKLFHITGDSQHGKGWKNLYQAVTKGVAANRAGQSYLPFRSLLEAGGTTQDFWERRMNLMGPMEFPLTWKDGYQVESQEIVDTDPEDREKYMNARMEFINRNEDGTNSNKPVKAKKNATSAKKMYHSVICFNWDKPIHYNQFMMQDNKEGKHQTKTVPVTFAQFMEDLMNPQTKTNYYEYINKSNIIPIKTGAKPTKVTSSSKAPPRIQLNDVHTENFDAMSYYLGDVYNMDKNTMTWKELVSEPNMNVSDVLLNCFHEENIIMNENGKAIINPETVDLARMCIYHLKRLAENKGKKPLRSMNLSDEVKAVKNQKRNWEPSMYEVYPALANIYHREKIKQCKEVLLSDEVMTMTTRLKAVGIMSDHIHKCCNEQRSPRKGTDSQHLGQNEDSTATSDQQIAVRQAETTVARDKNRKRKQLELSRDGKLNEKIPRQKKQKDI